MSRNDFWMQSFGSQYSSNPSQAHLFPSVQALVTQPLFLSIHSICVFTFFLLQSFFFPPYPKSYHHCQRIQYSYIQYSVYSSLILKFLDFFELQRSMSVNGHILLRDLLGLLPLITHLTRLLLDYISLSSRVARYSTGCLFR